MYQISLVGSLEGPFKICILKGVMKWLLLHMDGLAWNLNRHNNMIPRSLGELSMTDTQMGTPVSLPAHTNYRRSDVMP